MLIFLENEKTSNIYQRMLALQISKEFASKLHGEIFSSFKQDSEQENRRRELLAVEQQAHQNKIIAEHGEHHFKAQIGNQLYAKITAVINNDFDDKEKLFHQILRIEDATAAILDILAVKAASISRIKPLVNSLSWLADDLIHLVNKPQYRKRADVQIHAANVALSYIGLDNLKLVMPTFILKHWLPQSTSPFSLMKRKIWNNSLSIAITASILAKQQNLDEFTAFTAGMFSTLGQLTVCKTYITAFHEIHGEEVRLAFKNKDKRLHDVLVGIKMSPDILLEQFIKRNAQVSAEIVELMRFERLALTEPLFDLAYTSKFQNMNTIAQVIVQAQAYVAFRNLAKENLIDNDEAKVLFTTANLSPANISLLKKSDIDHLKLKFK